MLISSLVSPLVSDSMWLSCIEHNGEASQQARRNSSHSEEVCQQQSIGGYCSTVCVNTSHDDFCRSEREWRSHHMWGNKRQVLLALERLIGLLSSFSISSFTTSVKNTDLSLIPNIGQFHGEHGPSVDDKGHGPPLASTSLLSLS